MTSVAARVYGANSRVARLSELATRAADRGIRRQVAYLAETDDVGRARRRVQQATSLAGRLNAERSSEEARAALERLPGERRSVLV